MAKLPAPYDEEEEKTPTETLKVGAKSPVARPAQKRRDMHALSPTSQMIDTAPNEFMPFAPSSASDDAGESASDDAGEADELLAGPSSNTMQLGPGGNPALAFAPKPPSSRRAGHQKTPAPAAPVAAAPERGTLHMKAPPKASAADTLSIRLPPRKVGLDRKSVV